MYEDRVNTGFQGKEVPKEDASYKCLSLIVLDFVIRVSKNYYPQTLLEECKYVIRKNKMENLINDDLDLSSSDNETDNEYETMLKLFFKNNNKNLMYGSKDSEEIRTIYSKSDNIEILIGNKTNESIEELFESPLQRYQKELKEKCVFQNLFLIMLIHCIINVIR